MVSERLGPADLWWHQELRGLRRALDFRWARRMNFLASEAQHVTLEIWMLLRCLCWKLLVISHVEEVGTPPKGSWQTQRQPDDHWPQASIAFWRSGTQSQSILIPIIARSHTLSNSGLFALQLQLCWYGKKTCQKIFWSCIIKKTPPMTWLLGLKAYYKLDV